VQVALGLEYMQYMELVYRDLKPENILINVNGYLKVTVVAVVVTIYSTIHRHTCTHTLFRRNMTVRNLLNRFVSHRTAL